VAMEFYRTAMVGARSRDEQSEAKVEASSGTREETQTSTLEGAEARGTRPGMWGMWQLCSAMVGARPAHGGRVGSLPNRWRVTECPTSGHKHGIFQAYSVLGVLRKVVAHMMIYKTH
jgi:hypothetical protein